MVKNKEGGEFGLGSKEAPEIGLHLFDRYKVTTTRGLFVPLNYSSQVTHEEVKLSSLASFLNGKTICRRVFLIIYYEICKFQLR